VCGISGIINKNNISVNSDDIKKINNIISHRGPDDEGFFYEKNFAFGHRRLSILDLSNDGHQPMHYLNKYTITYNGEIYNYLEIKEELLQNGYSFQSNTDTEVILAAYDNWGDKCVSKFNGMWAFALYDKEKEIIFCSRDRFGIKPFYYTETDNKFIFGSEIKQLFNTQEKKLVNTDIVIDYIVTSIIEHTNETFFKGIKKLEASHNLVYDLKTNKMKIEAYYEIVLDAQVQNLSLDKAVSSYKKEFDRAIKYRLRSDVNVGSCLSGGLDSSSVTAIAASLYQGPSKNKFSAIHAKSCEKVTDESSYAKEVAEVCNIDLNIIEPSTQDFINSIDEVVYTQEEPFGSPSIFMQYFVMKKAKDIGCTVMLDGQGGDETLLGYEKYYPSAYIDIFKNYGILQTFKEIRKSNQNNSKMSLLWILKYSIGSLLSTLRKKEYKRRTSFMKTYNNNFSFFDDLAKHYSKVHNLQKYEINYTNLPILLKYEDKNSMRHSIETRLPFLDYKTLEVALSIDIKHKIKDGWTKYILRKMINPLLPKSIVWRKSKLGFNAPENIWMKEIQEKMEEEISKSKILKEITYIDTLLNKLDTMDLRLKWRLYNVAVWERVYNVKIN